MVLPRRPRRRRRRTAYRGRRNAGRLPRRRLGRSLPGRAVHQLRAAGYRDLIALDVHALHVRHVVTALHRPAVGLAAVGTCRRPTQQPDSGAGGGSHSSVASSGTYRSPGCCPENRSDGGPTDRSFRRRPTRRRAGLLQSPLTADRIVDSELLEVLPAAGKHHDVRTHRHRHARRQKHTRPDWQETQFPHRHSPR